MMVFFAEGSVKNNVIVDAEDTRISEFIASNLSGLLSLSV